MEVTHSPSAREMRATRVAHVFEVLGPAHAENRPVLVLFFLDSSHTGVNGQNEEQLAEFAERSAAGAIAGADAVDGGRVGDRRWRRPR